MRTYLLTLLSVVCEMAPYLLLGSSQAFAEVCW